MYDVVIAGRGYMVRAGTYERRQSAPDPAQTGRVRLFDFYGGGGRAAQLERDRFWRGVGAWPALDSQGIQAGPRRQDRTETPATAFDPERPSFSFVHGGTTYVANGTGLYRVTSAGGAYDGLALVQTLAAPCTGLAVSRGFVGFVHGPGERPTIYDLATGTYTTSAAQPATIVAPGRGALLIDQPTGGEPELWAWAPWLDALAGTPVSLDQEIVAVAPFNGEV
jgi:hypothetical protein